MNAFFLALDHDDDYDPLEPLTAGSEDSLDAEELEERVEFDGCTFELGDHELLDENQQGSADGKISTKILGMPGHSTLFFRW